MFAFGCILYELAHRRKAFSGDVEVLGVGSWSSLPSWEARNSKNRGPEMQKIAFDMLNKDWEKRPKADDICRSAAKNRDFRIGDLLTARGKLAPAVEMYQRGLGCSSGDPYIPSWISNGPVGKEMISGVREAIAEVFFENWICLDVAEYLQQAGDYSMAVEAYRYVLSQPALRNNQLYNSVADCYFGIPDYAGAIELLVPALTELPSPDWQLYLKLGVAHERVSNVLRAKAVFQEGLGIAPGNVYLVDALERVTCREMFSKGSFWMRLGRLMRGTSEKNQKIENKLLSTS